MSGSSLAGRVVVEPTEPAGWTLTPGITSESLKRIGGEIEAAVIIVDRLSSDIVAVVRS